MDRDERMANDMREIRKGVTVIAVILFLIGLLLLGRELGQ